MAKEVKFLVSWVSWWAVQSRRVWRVQQEKPERGLESVLAHWEGLWYCAVEQWAAVRDCYRKQERQQPERSELNYFQLLVTELAAGTWERISLLSGWWFILVGWSYVWGAGVKSSLSKCCAVQNSYDFYVSLISVRLCMYSGTTFHVPSLLLQPLHTSGF